MQGQLEGVRNMFGDPSYPQMLCAATAFWPCPKCKYVLGVGAQENAAAHMQGQLEGQLGGQLGPPTFGASNPWTGRTAGRRA